MSSNDRSSAQGLQEHLEVLRKALDAVRKSLEVELARLEAALGCLKAAVAAGEKDAAEACLDAISTGFRAVLRGLEPADIAGSVLDALVDIAALVREGPETS